MTPRPLPPPGVDPLEDNRAPPSGLPVEEGIDLKRVIKVIELLTSSDHAEAEKAYGRATASIFAYICRVIGVDITEIDLQHRTAKKLLYEKILHEVSPCISRLSPR